MGEEQLDEGQIVAYQLVAARQLHYNGLLWQVPVLSLTAQAFLFTIALDPGTARLPRMVSAVLALATTFVSMQLMARHRQADVSDSHWLADFERTRMGPDLIIHGAGFKNRRDAHTAGGPLARIPRSFVIWMCALGLFGCAALLVIVTEIAAPQLLR